MTLSQTDGSTASNVEPTPNISNRMRRIETMFFMIAVPFVAYMVSMVFQGQKYIPNDSDLQMQLQMKEVMTTMRQMQETMSSMSDVKESMSSLRDIQDAVSSLRDEQDALAQSINSKENKARNRVNRDEKKQPKIQNDRKVHYNSKNLPALEDFLEYKQKTEVSKKMHRRLQTDDSTTAPDISEPVIDDTVPSEVFLDSTPEPVCTSIRFEIDLDSWPKETSWQLYRARDDEMLVNRTYTSDDELVTDVYEEDCLESTSYTIVVLDDNLDGIQCVNDFDGLPCFRLWVNGEEAPTKPFAGALASIEFDSTDLCVFQPVALLRLYFDPLFPGVSWIFTNENDGKEMELKQTLDENAVGDADSAYFTCTDPGIFSLEIFNDVIEVNSTVNETICDSECYEFSIGENPPLTEMNNLDGLKREMYVTIEGVSRERLCVQEPIIAPINTLSQFAFDSRVSQILNVVQAHSKLENIFAQGTVEYRATCFILYDDALKISAEDPRLPERYVLAVFLYATGQLPEIQLPLNPCLNDRLQCDDGGFITAIDWSREGFNGIIPTEIAHLSELTSLTLKEKELEGTIPTEFLRLSKLETINLSGNSLTGTIPSQLGGIKSLRNIALRQNQLSSTLPSELGQLSNLHSFDVNSNQLTGSIPTSFSKEIQIFSLSANKFSGTVPTEIGLLKSMWIFYAENNNIVGTLPSEMGQLRSMVYLDLSFNGIEGTIPPELLDMGFVEELILKDNLLTGTIPELFISDLLYLSNNSLQGEIPASIFNSTISALKLEDNNLVGAVTEDFCSNLSFAPGFEGIYDLTVDDSPWFLDDPLVDCPCCDDVNCHLWKNAETIIVGGTVKPDCPVENIVTFDVFERYVILDQVANVTSGEGVGSGSLKQVDLCLSPTGCFAFFEEREDGRNDGSLSWDDIYNFGYSSSSRGLRRQETCDAVDVCGTLFAPDDPKRAGLNHLTHIVASDLSILDDPSSPEAKALCFVMTQDVLYESYDICDGTLLQRYVMALFYYSQQESFGFDELWPEDTCDWRGVTCDSKRRFIEKVELPEKNLTGALITEIGLLSRLQTLDLSKNRFIGSIDPVIFDYLPFLEIFNVGENKFGATIPEEVLMLPTLKAFNISNNLIVSTIPQDIGYAKTLVSFDVENNLVTGSVPRDLIDCPDIVEINLSRNNLKGSIFSEFGDLSGLEILKLNQNSLSGSIPEELFKATTLKTLQLQSNVLTGSIPVRVGDLTNAIFIAFNHNGLKGPIPVEIETLPALEFLHLHANTLTGPAPVLPRLRDLGDDNRYMTDCGSPSWALSVKVSCETCTTCCNSEGMCQTNRIWSVPIETTGFLVVFAVPIVVAFLLLIIFKAGRSRGVSDPRDPLLIFDTDSTYCLILSSNKLAYCVYMVTFFVQGCFYYVFLLASSFTHVSSDWQFTLLCPNTDIDCNDQNTLDKFGWFLFYVVTLSSLGVEIANSTFQVRKGVFLFDFRLLLSGALHLGMTVLAIFASVYYNLALATSNTELIVNAVILLFINDLDEQFMNFLQTTVPTWVEARVEEITLNMETKIDRPRPKTAQKIEIDDDSDGDSAEGVMTELAGSYTKSIVHGVTICADEFD